MRLASRPMVLALLLAAASQAGAEGPFRISVEASAIGGLDRFARGAELSCAVDVVRLGHAARRSDQGYGLGLAFGALYDASLGDPGAAFPGAALLGLALRLVFSPDLALSVGAEFPLTGIALSGSALGGTVALEPAGLPCSLALEAGLLELPRRDEKGPRIDILGSLGYSMYRAKEAVAAATQKALSGRPGFESGFRAGLSARVAFRP